MGDARDAVLTPLFRRHVRRPRLTSLLEEATAQALLVTGPAGYGKTTLAREWLQGREHVVWYHATPGSADVGAFSAGLADTVAPLVPDAGERVRRRLRVGDDTERLARPLAELLAEDIDSWPEDGVVVLDDYHLLAESKPVEAFLDWLLSLAPLRVLVTTRRRPSWATARRFLYGEAVEIGRDQLAMTDEEAMEVLQGRSTTSARALVRRAEGWPALIGLASLSADLDAPEERVSESLFRYFAEEVLRSEPPEVQRFMLAASVPMTVTPSLARNVLGFDAPGPIVERLRDADLLREVAGDEFRFHRLLREFLRRRLAASDPDRFATTARRIVEDAREHGRWEEAFELSREAGRAPEAAEIAGTAARALLSAGQGETLEKWLTACEGAAVTVPGAALARAELLIRKGEMSAAASLAQDTAALLPEEHPDYAWACTLSGRALHFTSQEEAAFERFEAGKAAAKTDEDIKESLWGLVLTATEIAPESMRQHLSEFEKRYPNDIDVRFRLAVGHALAGELDSTLRGVWRRFETLLPSVQHANDPLVASTFIASAASVAVLRGRYIEGRDLAEHALRLCTESRVSFAIGACHIYKAAAEIGLRRFPNARRSLQTFSRVGTWEDDPYFHLEALVLRARLLASMGALEEALATRVELPESHEGSRPLGAYLGTLAVIHAAHGDSAEARSAAELARQQPSGVERTFCSALAEAIADDIDGNHAAFAEQLSNLVRSCAEADYLDGLVLAYRVYPTVLQVLRDDHGTLGVVRDLLGRSQDFVIAKRARMEARPASINDPLSHLTRREREVLSLLLEGMTNAQIAERLFISKSTAKVHVRHILEKLGVTSRLQAVLRAQELLDIEAD